MPSTTVAVRIKSAEREQLESLRRARGCATMSELLTSMIRDLLAASDRGSEAGSACKQHEDRAAHDETCPLPRSQPVGLCARCGAIVRLAGEGQLLEETDGAGITERAGRPDDNRTSRAEISAGSCGVRCEKPRAGLQNPKRKGGADEAPPIEEGSSDD